MCREYGSKVVVVNQAYTSKTCSECGYVKHNLGGSKVFDCDECGGVMYRDVNGAKNIFLKNFEALRLSLALGPTPLLGGDF